ncbi:hypothetical protein FOL47_010083 [Perkinsus chesapeaki]|uniref:Uncharacterized protein n=1 Tax=Perkinsus chesapeaki TaxID=330153 RepID=A0A7J6L4W6_PERCH|nr:hypothetical protein FOL47_010083 [Perkinsus chesapeaki]
MKIMSDIKDEGQREAQLRSNLVQTREACAQTRAELAAQEQAVKHDGEHQRDQLRIVSREYGEQAARLEALKEKLTERKKQREALQRQSHPAPKGDEGSWGDTTFDGRYPPLISNLYVEKFSDAHAKLLHDCLVRGETPPLIVSHLQYETILSRRLCRVKLEQRRVLLGLNPDGRRIGRYKWKTRSDYANSRSKCRGKFIKEKDQQLAIEDSQEAEGQLQLEDAM